MNTTIPIGIHQARRYTFMRGGVQADAVLARHGGSPILEAAFYP